MLDNLRSVLNNFYNESNFEIFQKALYKNYKFYIQNKKNELTYEDIERLLIYFIFLFYKKKLIIQI